MHSQGTGSRLRVLYFVATLLALTNFGYSQQKPAATNASVKRSVTPFDLPLTFEANHGQFNDQVRFLSRGAGYELFLTKDEAVLSLGKPVGSQVAGRSSLQRVDSIRLKLDGANHKAEPKAEDLLPGRNNYYFGNDPKRWRTGVSTFGRVRYRSVYPGIDMVYYGNQRRLEHDFVVAPGANPKKIRMSVTGANTEIAANGDLLLRVADSSVRLLKPVLYQQINGKRHQVDGRYRLLAGNKIGFEVGPYDKSRELVIDPVLAYSTYYGGSNLDKAFAVTVSNTGIVYVAGTTLSSDFPTITTLQSTYVQGGDAFVVALNPAVSGVSGVMFATFLGGSGEDEARAITVNNSTTDIFVAGTTSSSDFPTAAGGFPTQYHGGVSDGFVSQINTVQLGTLLFSGYLGGSGEDKIFGLAFDAANNHLLISGSSTSYDFPYNPPVGGGVVAPLNSQLFLSTDGSSSWTNSGGQPGSAIEGMDIQAFLVVPGSTAFYAAGSSGAWRSNDGQSWVPINDTLGANKITCLVSDPADATIVYACSPNGLWKYDSSGDQWTNIGGLAAGTQVNSILFDPNVAGKLYVAAAGGVYVSTDSGSTLSALNTGLPTSFDARSLVADASGNIYVGLAGDGASAAFWMLAGTTWINPGNTGLPAGTGLYADSLTYDIRNGRIYAGIENNGLWYTSDGGVNWTQAGTEFLSTPFASEINKVALDPVDQNVIYIGTENGIWESVDGASTFFRSDSGITTGSVRALAVDKSNSLVNGTTYLYAGSYTQQGFVVSVDSSYSYILATMFGGDGIVGTGANTGSNGSTGYGVATDPSGNIYAAGVTPSSASYIPGIGSGTQGSLGGDNDGVLMKFNSSGVPQWGTYLGGSGYEEAKAVAANANFVYVGGGTLSSDFPVTAGVLQSTCSNTCAYADAFVAQYTAAGVKQWATFLGGANFDEVSSIALNGSGQPVLGGETVGTTFPQANPLGAYPSIGKNGFVTTMNTAGNGLVFSTLLGGNSSSQPPPNSSLTGVAINGTNIFVAGYTDATDFPTTSAAPYLSLTGTYDAFVSEISTNGASTDVSISVSPTTLNPIAGNPVTFDITITNNSSLGPASNVKLGTNLALSDLTSPTGTCSVGPPAVCTFGNVGANASVTATATYTYPQAGTYVDSFTARTDDDDPTPANNQQNVTATVSAGTADLGIAISAPTLVARGSQFNYAVNLTNNGPAGASDFTFSVNFDASLTLLSAPPGCQLGGSSAICTVSTLNANQNMSFTFPVLAPSTTGTVNASASVTVAGDPNANNNSSSATTTVGNSADLVISAFTQSTSIAGAPVTINLHFYANGPDSATGVNVKVPLPNGVSFNSASGFTCSGTGTLTCTVASISSNPDMPNTASLTLTLNQPGSLTISGSIQGNEGDPVPSNNTFSITFPNTPNSGASEMYLVSETNTGQIAAYGFGDSSTGSVFTSQAGSGPGASAIDQSGRYAFVNSSGFTGYTSVVDFSVGREIARIHGAVGRPMVLTPDGSRLITRYKDVAPGSNVDRIAVVDTSTFQILRTISLDGLFGDKPGVSDISIISGVVANNKVYLEAVTGGPTPSYPIITVDLATNAVSQVSGVTGHNASGQRIIARSADQAKVYALRRDQTSTNPGSMLVINTASDTVTQSVSVGINNPESIDVTKDANDPLGQFAYVSGRDIARQQNVVEGIDLSALTIAPITIYVSFNPSQLLLSQNGTVLHVFQGGAPSGNSNAALIDTSNFEFDSGRVQEYAINSYIGAVSGGYVSSQPLTYGPSPYYAYPTSITDTSVATNISIFGQNFAPGALVKFGNLDPVAATFVSSGRLDFTVPAGTPEQDANIVVTQPNPQELPTARNVSGGYDYNRVKVSTPYQLNDALHVLHYGDSSLDLVAKSKDGPSVGTIPNPFTQEFSADGSLAYIGNNALPYIQVLSLVTGQEVAQIPVANDTPGFEDGFAVSTDPTDGKPVLYYVAIDDINSQTPSDQLFVVDLDPQSQTYNQVKRTIRSPFNGYAGFSVWTVRATSDGRYVYVTYDTTTDGETRLEQFDTVNGTVSGYSKLQTNINAEDVPNHMEISPDDNYVILPGTDGSLKVIDVTSRDLTSPTTFTISDSGKNYKNFKVVGTRLFAFDAISNTIAVFNFLPAQSDFTKLGQLVLPGPGSSYVGAMTVDPTGSYIYLNLTDQDTIVVLDANKVAASDSTAVLAKGNGGLGVIDIQVANSLPAQQVDLNLSMFSNPVVVGQSGTVYANVSNSSSATANNVVATFTIPSGITVSTASFYLNQPPYTNGDCTVTSTTVTCDLGSIGSSSGNNAAYITLNTDPIATAGNSTFMGTVSSTEADSNPSDNSSSTQLMVTQGADTALSATLPTGSVTPGQQITINFTITNNGPVTATSINFGLSTVADNPIITGPGCPGNTSNCTLVNVLPGTPMSFQATATIPSRYPTVNFDLYSSSSPADPDSNNNYANSTVTVTSAGTLTAGYLLSNRGFGQIWPYDLSDTFTSLGTGVVTAGATPNGSLVMPNGRIVFNMNLNADYMSVSDLALGKEIGRVRGVKTRTAALTPDSSQIIAADFAANNIAVIDTTTFQVVRRITGTPGNIANLVVAGTKAYFMTATAGPVNVLDLTNDSLSTVSGTNVTGSFQSNRMAVAPDGIVLALGVGGASPLLLRIDPSTNSVLQSIPISPNTNNLTLSASPVSASTIYAYVTADTTLQAIDITTGSGTLGQVVANVTLPITPATSTIFVAPGNPSVTKLGFLSAPDLLNMETTYAVVDEASIFNTPSVASSVIGGELFRIQGGNFDLLPSPASPTISNVTPSGFLNDAPVTLEIDGSNFSNDALVKVGNADPIPATFISSNQLSVTVPKFTPSGSLDVIVINRNAGSPLDQRNAAGMYTDQIQVVDGPGYLGQWNAYTANFGDGSVTGTMYTDASTDPIQISNPSSVAVNGAGIYLGVSVFDPLASSSFSMEGPQVIHLPVRPQVNGQLVASITDPQTGRPVMLVPGFQVISNTTDPQLSVIDADPYSPTVNLITRTINANSPSSANTGLAFAATPDGRTAFQFNLDGSNSVNVVVYNLTNASATVVPASSFGIDNTFFAPVVISPDSKYMVLGDPTSNTFKVFNITNPTAPVAAGTITANPCCGVAITSTQFWSYDTSAQNLQVFNFSPQTSSFGLVGSITVPGSVDSLLSGNQLAVSPDGNLVYLTEANDDSLDVFDATKVAASDPTALITRIATGLAPRGVALNPVPTFSTSADVALTLTHTPEPVIQGSDVTFNVSVTNNGPFSSGSEAFSDTLPAGMLVTSITPPSAGSCTGINTGTVQCSLGDGISAGVTLNFSFTASTSGVSGTLQNVGTVVGVRSTTPDPNTANNTVIENLTVGNPDLAISLSADTQNTGVNGTVNYTATITNNGTVTANNVRANLSLDAGTLVSTPDCGIDGAAFCSVSTLDPNQTVTFHVTATMPAAPGTATMTGTVTEDETDANTADNTATLAVTVVNPDLAISITASPNTPVIDNLVTYTAVITNNSVATATSPFAQLHIDAGNITSSTECNLDGDAYCNLSNLGPGQSATVHVIAQMPATAGTVTMTGTVTETETDANPADNSTSLALTVGGGADLQLSAADKPVILSGVPTYTVTVTNNGPDLAPNVMVTDELTRFQFVSAVSSVGACSYDGIKIACPIGNLANGASATVSVSVVPPNSGWASSEFHATSDTLDPNNNNNGANLGPTGGVIGNTKAGFNVQVDVLDPNTGMPASFNFTSVTKPGLTSVTSSNATQPPAGFRFGQPARIYDLSTTASYAGNIQVTLQFAGTVFHHPAKVRLFHLENGVWVDRTTGIDSVRGMVAGMTTSLSPFILAEPLDSAPVANAGNSIVAPGASINGSQVSLNGAASSDADGDALTYRWTGPFPEGNGTVTGASPSITLPIGASQVQLVVNDGEVDSSPATLNVVVSDFLVAGASGQVNLKRGQSASFDVAVTPKFGAFDAQVALACENVPAGVTCSIANPTVTPGGTGVTATVTLTASNNAGLRPGSSPVFAFWFGGLPVFGLLMTGSLRPKNWRGWALLVILLVLMAGMIACGGGAGASSSPNPSTNPGTTPSTTTSITITGTSGGIQHSATTTVVIQ